MHTEVASKSTTTAIEVDVRGRWDALALSELLIPFHSYLVQHDREHWIVHAQAPGCRGETLSEALAAIDDWRSGRDLQAVSCRVAGRPYHLHKTRAA